jgi:exopolysaccharide biosynthesis predicted pyruvyltransferase EpsI
MPEVNSTDTQTQPRAERGTTESLFRNTSIASKANPYMATLRKKFKMPNGISPTNTTTPTRIDLFQTDNPGILKRHECIRSIRQRIHQTLNPYVMKFPKQTEALVIDPAFHANVGDNMIYAGERELLTSLGFNDSHIEICSYFQASNFAKNCGAHLNKKNPSKVAHSIAYWHGGGNWGDLWPSIQFQRVRSFERLLKANYSILGIPQSFHYDSNTKKDRDTAIMKKGIAEALGLENLESEGAQQIAASRLTLTWRELKSFEEASKEYPFAKHLLVPDVAFNLGPFLPIPSPQKKRFQLDILVFLRDDKESIFASQRSDKQIRRILDSVAGGSELKFGIADWNTRFALWPSEDFLFTESSIKLLSLGRVVICDRLHASILCYLSGIP